MGECISVDESELAVLARCFSLRVFEGWRSQCGLSSLRELKTKEGRKKQWKPRCPTRFAEMGREIVRLFAYFCTRERSPRVERTVGTRFLPRKSYMERVDDI